jgi:hypothetical protein
MKFVRITMMDSTKVEEMTKISDKTWASPPPGIKMEAFYACLGMPFPNAPPNTMTSISVVEAESAEALASVSYPLMQAGATIWAVPVLEIPVGGTAEAEKKFRG